MGWVNYVLVKKYKIAFVVDRSTDELDGYFEKALDWLRDDERARIDEEKKLKDVSVRDFAVLFNTYEKAVALEGASSAMFLLYFLKKYGVEFEIQSEFNVDEEKLRKAGWVNLPPANPPTSRQMRIPCGL